MIKTCSRGHQFNKTSDCPVCPKCWSGYYRQQQQSDFPEKLGAPALRALLSANIMNLKQLTKFTSAQLSELHGMGPKGIRMLKAALQKKGLNFKS